MNSKTLSIVALAAIIPSAGILLFRQELLARGPVAIGVQVLAAGLMLWARATFGMRSFHGAANPTAGGLVTKGPYAFLRHPIYAAILWFVWAGVLTHVSVVAVALGLIVTAGTAVRIVAEERLLPGLYPEYSEYAARTKRVIPFVL